MIGDANPLLTGGFSLNARYKNFDVSSSFSFVLGNDIYNANKIEFTSTGKFIYRNMISDMSPGKYFTNVDTETGLRVTDAETLKALNIDATIWSPAIYKQTFHSWAVEDGSFLRLNNLTIGYTFPKEWVTAAHLQNLRVYASGNNLLLLTKYSGYDPEVDTRRKTPLTPGVDYSAYPKSISYNLGVNITF